MTVSSPRQSSCSFFCCFPREFNKPLLKSFEKAVEPLFEYEQAVDGNQIVTQDLIQRVSNLRQTYKITRPYPIRLEMIFLVHQIFSRMVLGITKSYVQPLASPQSEDIQQQVKHLLDALTSKEGSSSTTEEKILSLYPNEIKTLKEQAVKTDHPVRTTILLVKELFNSNLPNSSKQVALTTLLKIQTDSQIREFLIKNLDNLIKSIQSNQPLEELLPLLNAYDIEPQQIKSFRLYINQQQNLSPSQKTMITMQCLLNIIDSGKTKDSDKRALIHELHSRQDVEGALYKIELPYLIHLILSDELFNGQVLHAKRLSRAYGFNPENVFALRRLLKIHYEAELSLLSNFLPSDLKNLATLISGNSTIDEKSSPLILKYKIKNNLIEYLKKHLTFIKELKNLEKENYEKFEENLARFRKNYSEDKVNSIMEDLLRSPQKIVLAKLLKKYPDFMTMIPEDQKKKAHNRCIIDLIKRQLTDWLYRGTLSLKKPSAQHDKQVAIETVEETLARL